MPKKKSSKTPKEPRENALIKEEKSNVEVVKNEKPHSAKKRSEIDEIFAGKKRKKPEAEKAEKSKVVVASDRPMKMKIKNRNNDEIADPPLSSSSSSSRRRKKTGDGLVLYTEEELGIGNADAGGTPLCPFDCSCCF